MRPQSSHPSFSMTRQWTAPVAVSVSLHAIALWFLFASTSTTVHALAPSSSAGTTCSSRRNFVQKTASTASLAGFATALTDTNFWSTQNNVLANAATLNAAASTTAVGAKAPDFDLPNARGGQGTMSLSKLTSTGKWTVLYFYPGAFTSGCTLEARAFQRDLDEYRTRYNAQIVGVSVDPVEKNAQFCAAEGLDFYLLSDTGGRVSNLYGSALSIPGFGTFSNRQTYLIDPNGNLRWVFTDVESRIARHSSEVLEKLAELQGKA